MREEKGSEFYNRSIKLILQNVNMEMYWTHNQGTSVAAERFIRTLEKNICKYMISISKNVYIDELGNIVNKYNNTYHSTINMKLVDVKSNTYIDSRKEINKKGPNLKIVTLLEYQNTKIFFQKFTLESVLKKMLWLKKCVS